MENSTDRQQAMIFDFLLPSPTANYDNFRLSIGEDEMSEINISAGRVKQSLELGPAETETVLVSYESQGMDQWWYDFGMEVSQAKKFSLVLNTNFANIVDFSEESISPTTKVYLVLFRINLLMRVRPFMDFSSGGRACVR